MQSEAGAAGAVHGALTDHIYQIEIDMTIGIKDFTIRAIDGKWLRAENSECRRAVPFLQNAVGIKIDADGFPQHVNKNVGRASCPHFANLIIECCDAAQDAADMIKFEAARSENPVLTFEEYLIVTSGESRCVETRSYWRADHY